MREIIFDTETTGLKAEGGDKIIEIGAIELVNRFPTGNTYHQYINADGKDIHPDAERVHGISADFLADKPIFADIAEDFVKFFTDAKLIAHNAKFDMGFVNAELKRVKMKPFPWTTVIDTLQLARHKHPMGPNSLDALCKRYNIDNSHRTKHGALLDAELLADVYIELLGGKQASLLLDANASKPGENSQTNGKAQKAIPRPNALPSRLNDEILAEHKAFIETIGEDAIWNKV
ncbi:MAG: DNA polymerase III subunit epsilon [Hyphomicrobiales bacterium]|nr:MAG: DNA polymerase III subunit epsilon [Hyphomicrobiales bacterium]